MSSERLVIAEEDKEWLARTGLGRVRDVFRYKPTDVAAVSRSSDTFRVPLQADLGDLLAEAIREPYQHQFLIETHSEHLVLRLQKLVRRGTLKPEDVSIVYVSRGETRSWPSSPSIPWTETFPPSARSATWPNAMAP